MHARNATVRGSDSSCCRHIHLSGFTRRTLANFENPLDFSSIVSTFWRFDDCRVDHCCNDKTTIYGTKETSALKSRQNEMKSNEPPVNLPAIYIFLPRVRTRTANSVRVYVGRVNETPTKSYISRVNLRRTPLCSSLLSWSCRTSGSRVSLSLCGETNDTLETVVNASIYTEATARETSTSLFRIFHRE